MKQASKNKSGVFKDAKFMANFLEISDRRLQQLAKEGVIPKARHNQYDFIAVTQAILRYHRKRNEEQSVEKIDINKQKARFLKTQADKAELEYKALEGRLVKIEDVQNEWQNLIHNCRAKLLSLPSSFASIALSFKTRAEFEKALTARIKQALNELSEAE